jgi:L-ribulose-5-phosphate 3-epimerase
MTARLPLRFAYNTNGFAHHRLADAVAILATLGYDGIALTLDWHHLDPLTASRADVERVRDLVADAGLGIVVETGARYLLDPWRKHEPTLVSAEGRERRIAFLVRAIEVARILGAETVTLFAGRLGSGVDRDQAHEWLRVACTDLARRAEDAGVELALEPEPGMFVERLADGIALIGEVSSARLGLALDIGHVRCVEGISEVEAIERCAPWLKAVHIEDIAGHEHVHRMFGEGDLVFEPILETLVRVRFGGLVSVELSRDSHRAPEAARAALRFLEAKTPRSS